MGIMNSLVDAIYPPHCLACGDVVGTGSGLCGSCWGETTFLTGTTCDLCGLPLPGPADEGPAQCDDCRSMTRPWQAGRAAVLYAGTGRRLVLSLKHGDRTDLPPIAAQWMIRAGADLLRTDTLVAPVPLHWIRLFRRRYNQSALLSAEVARQAGFAHCPDLMKRVRATPNQAGRTQQARFDNLAGAIALSTARQDRVAGRSVLLVDDVLTSGATLAACAEACLSAGAREVRVLALARAAKPD